MKNYIFNYTNSNGEEKKIELRLTADDCEQIEKTYNCTLLDYVQQCSITSIITLLQRMKKGAGESYTRKMTQELYDELVDSGYTMATILDEIIYEALVISGVITKEDLDNIRAEREKIKNMSNEEKRELIKERKNS